MHLTSLKDRLRVILVCSYWRRTFLQYAPLWSKSSLTGSTDRRSIVTPLEPAKGSPLDTTIDVFDSLTGDLVLLSPFTQQIKILIVHHASLAQVQELTAAIAGSVSVNTLNIYDYGGFLSDPVSPSDLMTLPLLRGAVDVKGLSVSTSDPLLLSHFTLPNLTSFNLWTRGGCEVFPISLLLNFLEGSPSLQTIHMMIAADLFYDDVPQDAILVLPNVKAFALDINSDSPGYGIAAHISCPSARTVEFHHQRQNPTPDILDDISALSYPWATIVCQYTTGVIEEIELGLGATRVGTGTGILINQLQLSSSEGATLTMQYVHRCVQDPDRVGAPLDRRASQAFSQASRKIRDYPLLANLRHLSIAGGKLLAGDLNLATSDVVELLGSMELLERFTLKRCDLRPYLDAFLDTPSSPDAIHRTSFPRIGKFTIVDPVQSFCDDSVYAAAIVRLAKSQLARGLPFDCMEFYTRVPSSVVEELLLSVNTVDVMS